VFRLLDWGDRIGLRLREDGQVRRQGEGLAGVAEADDLAVRPRACSGSGEGRARC
jgi:4-diphosphocytidyl-2-C-methyl-D-erythritol kinase